MMLLAIFLVAAVVTDLRSRRIPNGLVLAGIFAACLVHAFALANGDPALAGPTWWAPAAGLVVGLSMLAPLYLLRGCGAGDLKLMAMVGTFVGAKSIVVVALYTVLAGGLLAIVFMLDRGVARQTLNNMRLWLVERRTRTETGPSVSSHPLRRTAARLPYALAIALGTAAALLWPALGGVVS